MGGLLSSCPCAILRILLASGWDLVKRRGGEEQRSLHPADSAVPTWLSRSSAPCAAGCPPVALPDGSEGLGLLGWAGLVLEGGVWK